MSEAARSRRDDPRSEPQMPLPGRDASSREADPLAELARLVGQDDRYRDVFRSPAEPVRGAHGAEIDHHHGFAGDPVERGEAYASSPYEDGHVADAPHVDHGYHDHHDPHGFHVSDDRYHAAAQGAYADEAGLVDERFSPDAAAAIPDLWARGDEGANGSAPQVDHAASAGRGSLDRSSARRPLAVLAAVLLLTGGGLAATYLAKGNSASGTVAASRSAPTIMAAAGPTKVKADDGSATAPEDQDAALLNRSGTVSSGPVKIVSSQEQPADLGQLPKSDLAEGARPLPAPSGSPFPEPKKVKTFVVHPDGSMLSSDGNPALAGSSGTAAGSPSSSLEEAPAAALPATPRTVARSTTTPQSASPAPTIASLTTDTAPPVAAPASPKPIRQSAAPGPHDASTGGSFGLQLASSPIEAEANAAFAKLKKKYPAQLGAYTATVHKAETGDKPVYRVRVGGLSQDDAKALCSQLQTAGGSCFVVHN